MSVHTTTVQCSCHPISFSYSIHYKLLNCCYAHRRGCRSQKKARRTLGRKNTLKRANWDGSIFIKLLHHLLVSVATGNIFLYFPTMNTSAALCKLFVMRTPALLMLWDRTSTGFRFTRSYLSKHWCPFYRILSGSCQQRYAGRAMCVSLKAQE